MLFANVCCRRFSSSYLFRMVSSVNVKLLAISQMAVEKLKYVGIAATLENCSLKIDFLNVFSKVPVECLSNPFPENSNNPLSGGLKAERACSFNRLFSQVAFVILAILWGMNFSASSLSFPLVFVLTCISLSESFAEVLRTVCIFSYIKKWSLRISQGFQSEHVSCFLTECFRLTLRSLRLAKYQNLIFLFSQLFFLVLKFYFFFIAHYKIDLAFLLLGLFVLSIEFLWSRSFRYYCDSLNAFDATLAVLKRDLESYTPDENLLLPYLNHIKKEILSIEEWADWNKCNSKEIQNEAETLMRKIEACQKHIKLCYTKDEKVDKTDQPRNAQEQMFWNLHIRRLTAALANLKSEAEDIFGQGMKLQFRFLSKIFIFGEVCASSCFVKKHMKNLMEMKKKIIVMSLDYTTLLKSCCELFPSFKWQQESNV